MAYPGDNINSDTGGLMKLSRTILEIAIIILICAVVLMSVYIGLTAGASDKVKEQAEYISYLEEENTRIDFAYTTASMEIDNLGQVIASKGELILELKVDQAILELYKETFKYTVVWIVYAEKLLKTNNIPHFEYIGQSILDGTYYEDIEDQVDYFEEIEE